MDNLSRIENDVYSELFNSGIARAAATSSEIIDLVSSPYSGDIATMCESYSGKLQGETMMLLTDQRGLKFKRRLLNENDSLDILSEREQVALIDVGYMILTGCLNRIAGTIQEEISTGLSIFTQGNIQSVLEEYNQVNPSLTYHNTLIGIQKLKIQGYISLLMDPAALNHFKAGFFAVTELTAEC